ncbi:hypothetical protein [Amphibacillus jilinensis]|uniref:hypothetical protein n=1 Tax=Amphibacillus jilinensis TaxID=1216008 RepID=UPI0002DF3067|nr:hypothetical protein [Amphibacillus jilinensis]
MKKQQIITVTLAMMLCVGILVPIMLSNQNGKQISRAEGNMQGSMIALDTYKAINRNSLDKYITDDLFVSEDDDSGEEEEEGLHVLEVEEEKDIELAPVQTPTAPASSPRDRSSNNNPTLRESDKSNGKKLSEQDEHRDEKKVSNDQLDKPKSDSDDNKNDQEKIKDEEIDEESEPTEEVTDNEDHEKVIDD